MPPLPVPSSQRPMSQKTVTQRIFSPAYLWGLALASTTAPALGWAPSALAHGAHLTHRAAGIEVTATYDGGQPMVGAQVQVYAPDDPSTPWAVGTTDDEGRYWFTPDAEQPGNWEVMVRQAGHGDVLAIPVGQTEIVPVASASPLQRGVAAGAVVWGCVGTALFFARGKR